MSSRLLIFSTLVILFLTPLGASAEDQPISDSYRKTLSTLLELMGASVAGEQVSYGVAQETLGGIAGTGVQITEQIQQIVVEESLSEFKEKFGDIQYLTELYAPLYAEQLNEKEIGELVAFYQSPIGQKMLSALPIIGQGGAMALQQASFEMIPDFQTKLDAKLRSMGIVIAP